MKYLRDIIKESDTHDYESNPHSLISDLTVLDDVK